MSNSFGLPTLPARLTRWLRRQLGITASDAALAAHSRLLSEYRRDLTVITARLKAQRGLLETTETHLRETTDALHAAVVQLNGNTRHLKYLQDWLAAIASEVLPVQKATATYHRALSKAIEQAQEAADRASAAAAHHAVTDTAPPLETATGEALSANAGHLGDIPHAALLPLADGPADPVEAEVGQG